MAAFRPSEPLAMHSSFPGMDPYLEAFLQAILNECCEEGRCVDDIDYREEPDPPLGPDDAKWADALLKEQGYR
jgi:hypothetical protein